MTISNRSSVLESNNLQLTQSANSLDSALTQFNKLAAAFEHVESVSTPTSLPNTGKGFDEWIASDPQYDVLLGGEESPLSNSPLSVSTGSPLIEQDPVNSNFTSLFDCISLPQVTSNQTQTQAVSTQSLNLEALNSMNSLGVTTESLQRAAAALHIPWSHEFEESVLRQTQRLSNMISNAKTTESSVAPSLVKNGKHQRESESTQTSEELLAKRAKNTDAARRSRLKKMVKLEGLETKVKELEATNHQLNTKIAVLETEKNGFLIKEAERNARIAQLEAKIAEAHFTLKTRQINQS